MYSIEGLSGTTHPWMEDLYDNLDMIFVASGPLFEAPRQVAPIVKQIPGLTIKPESKLNFSNVDIFDFLERSTQGVVLFSLGQTGVGGGNYITSEFKEKLIQGVLGTPFNAVIHLDPDLVDFTLKDPDRLFFGKWLPNQEILAHPNTRVFLSHVGLASFQEAMFHNVPILAMPTFEDQFEIAKAIEDREIGEVIWDKAAITRLKSLKNSWKWPAMASILGT
ncbi:hypothetical protein TCAL_14481 [Tigriopus californicus]|uniref:Glucuronosyltransferase n=2 Tax=Tigriopus californicus TaxID=6832 RepID=A0A553PSR4_TIGCA|nr:hypothetical protein TCAL_14481 [Tigriopus californicus]